MRVGGADIRAAVGRPANDDRTIDQAAAHVTDLAGIVDDLVVRHGAEAPEHQLDHGSQPEHRGADSHAYEGGFTDWRIDDPLVPEFFPKTPCHLVGAVILGDFFADEDDIGIAFDLLGERLVESISVFDEWHGSGSPKCH